MQTVYGLRNFSMQCIESKYGGAEKEMNLLAHESQDQVALVS
jgi:hypothetical protein